MFRRKTLRRQQNTPAQQNAEKEFFERRVAHEAAAMLSREKCASEKMKVTAMAEMVATLAHQWRQPLHALSFLMFTIKESFLQERLDNEKMEQYYAKAMHQIKLMSNTIEEYRTYFKEESDRIMKESGEHDE